MILYDSPLETLCLLYLQGIFVKEFLLNETYRSGLNIYFDL